MYFYYPMVVKSDKNVNFTPYDKNKLLNFGDLVDMRRHSRYVIRKNIISVIDIFNNKGNAVK
mgnify:CR=1 FL=1|jgi:hypothetical protein|tara:strand:- start:323 stop:508 length:186 start_codon:yes stop_codon:yes gene_type:complete